MKINVIKLTSLVLLLLVTGLFWGTWFTLTRTIGEFPAVEFIHLGKVIIANVATPMKFIMPSCILFLLFSMLLEYRENRRGAYLIGISLFMMILSLLITLLVEVPIDNMIKNWTIATTPGNWRDIRETWASYHALRTGTSLGSFLFFGMGLLIPHQWRR